MTLTAAPTAPEQSAVRTLFPTLTAHDRCDRCSQPAVAQFQVSSGLPNVLVCGHHWRKVRASVESLGYLFKTTLNDIDSEQYTNRSHAQPWPNQFRDAGSANA